VCVTSHTRASPCDLTGSCEYGGWRFDLPTGAQAGSVGVRRNRSKKKITQTNGVEVLRSAGGFGPEQRFLQNDFNIVVRIKTGPLVVILLRRLSLHIRKTTDVFFLRGGGFCPLQQNGRVCRRSRDDEM